MITSPKNILKKYWGHNSFRSIQEEIINSALDKKDTIALMPTGGGKSICFQIPVLAQDGIGIVISPLIALMKDQVENLQRRNIKAIAIYSGMTYREIDVALDNCVYGDIKFLYISPERLVTKIFQERVKKMNVSLIAVDEAHCVSQWGHDFRPSYHRIPEIKSLLKKNAPLLAVTATANNMVVNDIEKFLELQNTNIYKQSFERTNLGYLVLHEENKQERLLKIILKANSSGIVYVNTRKATVEIANFLKRNGISADFYHGGLSEQARTKKQLAWVNNKNKMIVATNAFGMGIDKPDVRIVVHLDPPSSPEAYFQEAGRAGRDGQRSYATLLYKKSDRLELEKMHELEFPDQNSIKKIYNALGNYFQLAIGSGAGESYIFNIGEFGARYSLRPITIFNSIKILELNDYLHLSDAIYHPTTIKILVSAEDLYQIQVKNKLFDVVLRYLLRSYPGIFENYKKADPQIIANACKVSREQVHQILIKLKDLSIIDYIEAHDSPLLTYLSPRINEKNIKLSKESYQERKKVKKNQLDFMIRYCEEEFICRNRLLLSYFDETSFKDCGICDVCIASKKSKLNNHDFESISKEIRTLLHEPKAIKEVVNLVEFSEEKTVKVIQFMLDQNILLLNKYHQIILKNKQ